MLFENSNGFLFPDLLFLADLSFELLETRLLTILFDLHELFLNVSERSDSVIDEEVVHHVRIVSLERNSIWTNDDSKHTFNLLGLVVFIIRLRFVALIFFRFLADTL